MGCDYIPEADGAAANWMRAFADTIEATPEAYMLTPSVAVHVGEHEARQRTTLAAGMVRSLDGFVGGWYAEVVPVGARLLVHFGPTASKG